MLVRRCLRQGIAAIRAFGVFCGSISLAVRRSVLRGSGAPANRA